MVKSGGNTNILLEHIVSAIKIVKGKEIISLDLQKIESVICKYFVICTGTSNVHVNAIEGNIKKHVSRIAGEKPHHIEGANVGEWIVMDYSDIIVHIFQEKMVLNQSPMTFLKWRSFFKKHMV